MNEKTFLGTDENYEFESKLIEFKLKPEMTFDDLPESDKAEFIELNFSMEEALELTSK